jgi:hypothetical protein
MDERSGEDTFIRACLEALVVRARDFRLGNVKEFDRQYFYMKCWITAYETDILWSDEDVFITYTGLGIPFFEHRKP